MPAGVDSRMGWQFSLDRYSVSIAFKYDQYELE